ncbi:hypothetical protein FL840_24490 [Vibrio parahaemolyticus]|nr:hypothetical protein [Vibrio parahaemolyticus]
MLYLAFPSNAPYSKNKHNAALSGEQRIPLHLKYCSVNTKDEANRKCRALGIRLKRLVIPLG